MGYDVKKLTENHRNKPTRIENLLFRTTIEQDLNILPDYQTKYYDAISKLIIPELSLSYLDDEKEWIVNTQVTNELQVTSKYNFKPELMVYEQYGDVDSYINDFLYLNNIFSRMDFTENQVSSVKIIDSTVIDGMKTTRITHMDSETLEPRDIGGSAIKLEMISDEDKALINADANLTWDKDDLKISDSLFRMIVSRFGYKNLNKLTRNFSNSAIANKLLDEINLQDLVKYLSRITVLESTEEKESDMN